MAAVRHPLVRCRRLEAERNVRQNEYDLLDDAARSFAQDKAAPWDSLMDTFVMRKRSAKMTTVEVDEQIEEPNTEIWRLNDSRKAETAAIVATTLPTKRDCRVEFQLTYCKLSNAWNRAFMFTLMLHPCGDRRRLATVLRSAREHI